MLQPELATDECQTCRTCRACLANVHSCCFPVECAESGRRHDCNCPICHPELLP